DCFETRRPGRSAPAHGDTMTGLADPATPVPHHEVRRYFAGSAPAAGWTRDIEALRRETREEALAVRGDLERVSAVETISIAGDSSGGNLAAAAALKARDRQIDIAAQVLIYPVLEGHMNSRHKRVFRTRCAGFLDQPEYGTVTFDRISYIWDTYVPQPHLRDC